MLAAKFQVPLRRVVVIRTQGFNVITALIHRCLSAYFISQSKNQCLSIPRSLVDMPIIPVPKSEVEPEILHFFTSDAAGPRTTL